MDCTFPRTGPPKITSPFSLTPGGGATVSSTGASTVRRTVTLSKP